MGDERAELKLPDALLAKLKWTNSAESRKTFLLTGMVGVGKTLMAQVLAEAIVGPGKTFLMDFPEEEGTDSLGDYATPYYTFTSQRDLDEWYPALVAAKPEAIIWDSIPSAYTVFMRERAPSGVPPEDRGKTWMAVAIALRREIIRFKMIPSVKVFIGTSLVWPDNDEITGREGRLQVTLPGALKSNIYGLFSFDLNLLMDAGPDGRATRVIEFQPTPRSVARVRAPLSAKIPARMAYNLEDPKQPGRLNYGTVRKILELLRIEPHKDFGAEAQSPLQVGG